MPADRERSTVRETSPWPSRSSRTSERSPAGIGWIRTLGVRPPWRKRGLGEALLLHSFGEFYKRGTKTIGLGVDAQNPTGATRLYQKVGMVAVSEFVTYEKGLRSGREQHRASSGALARGSED